MKSRLIRIISCSSMKVTSVKEVYRINNHLYDMKEEVEEKKEFEEKRKFLQESFNFDAYC